MERFYSSVLELLTYVINVIILEFISEQYYDNGV